MTDVNKWRGSWPYNCDICKTDLTLTGKFYDAATAQGPWGLMCPTCFNRYGYGLGTGKGQEYDSKTLHKTGG